MSSFLAGLAAPWQGLFLILRPGMRRYVALPLLLNVLVYSAGIYWLLVQFSSLVDQWFPWWLAWLEWLLWPIMALALLFMALFTFARICHVLCAPFATKLCQAILRMQEDTPLSVAAARGQGRGAVASIGHEILKLGLFLLWFVPLSALSVIPFLGLPAALALLSISVYWNALEYIDYPLAEIGMPLAELRRQIHDQPMLMLGFGFGQTLLLLCPVINLASVPAGVAGATRMCMSRIRVENAR